jgi:hypothetical protein
LIDSSNNFNRSGENDGDSEKEYEGDGSTNKGSSRGWKKIVYMDCAKERSFRYEAERSFLFRSNILLPQVNLPLSLTKDCSG